MGVSPGDRVRLRKKHPCGSNEWLVEKAGAEISLECLGCGHSIKIDRAALERRLRPVSSARGEKKTN